MNIHLKLMSFSVAAAAACFVAAGSVEAGPMSVADAQIVAVPPQVQTVHHWRYGYGGSYCPPRRPYGYGYTTHYYYPTAAYYPSYTYYPSYSYYPSSSYYPGYRSGWGGGGVGLGIGVGFGGVGFGGGGW